MKTFDLTSPIVEVEDYLKAKGWLNIQAHIESIEKPGEGNMNVVLRIKTEKRSIILKQSRPFVQKYQQIAAPLERIAVEYKFYETISGDEINSNIPKIIGYDAEEYVLLLEDLGDCEDMSYLYQNRSIDADHLEKLVSILTTIHAQKTSNDFPNNIEMRQLNHQHIFVLPFMEDNGFQLDVIQDGLQALSMPYKQDKELKSIIDSIGKKYLSEGDTLLHGDYYPGSWMTKGDQIYVIDPEFSFVGFAEFDLGVMIAHVIVTAMDADYMESIFQMYSGKVDKKLTRQTAGIEIMRRMIGLAQLPLGRTIEEKQYLLQTAHGMIV